MLPLQTDSKIILISSGAHLWTQQHSTIIIGATKHGILTWEKTLQILYVFKVIIVKWSNYVIAHSDTTLFSHICHKSKRGSVERVYNERGPSFFRCRLHTRSNSIPVPLAVQHPRLS
jgi:hypothetical protein